jgi:hypothetical protein
MRKADVASFLNNWFVKDTTENVIKYLDASRRKKDPPPLPEISGSRANDYTEIADFLSRKERWQPAVKKISTYLHEHYMAALLLGRTNAFTSAIAMIAPYLGFDLKHPFLSLAGFTDPNTFIGYVKAGAFWKDSVSSNHGEHSHSIQWLALALAKNRNELKTERKISTLYAESVEHVCKKPLYHPGSGENRILLLWDWLVDCFDFGDEEADFRTNIRSETARCPTHLNKYLFEQGSMADDALWIGKYLTRRHTNRGWALPVEDQTNLREHAIASAKARSYPQVAANKGGNFVYAVNTGIDGPGRLADLRTHGAETVNLKMTKNKDSIPSFSLCTSLNISFPVMNVKCPAGNKAFDALQGQFAATVQIVETGGGCEAKLVHTTATPPGTRIPLRWR